MAKVVDPRTFGKYKILRRISIGGMAEVYHAVFVNDQGFEKEVAVKRILPLIDQEQSFTEMFIHEAKIVSTLNHANIAQMYELGKIGNSYFIAMEYVHGETLRNVIRRMRAMEVHFNPWLAARIAAEVASGLHYAYNKKSADGVPLKIVHRDISPQNILLSFNGQVKIIDFGIAKASGRAFQTSSGIVKGKCSYMSPEQVRGKSVDQRSDLFSLGAVFYEMLSGGEKLFDGEDVGEIMDRIKEEPISPQLERLPDDIPPQLRAVLERMVKRDPDERYENASEIHRELMNAVLGAENQPSPDAISQLLHGLFPDSADDRKAIEEYATKHEAILDSAEERGEETTDQQQIPEATGVFITESGSAEELQEQIEQLNRLRTDLLGRNGDNGGDPATAGKKNLAREILYDVLISCVIISLLALLIWWIYS